MFSQLLGRQHQSQGPHSAVAQAGFAWVAAEVGSWRSVMAGQKREGIS